MTAAKRATSVAKGGRSARTTTKQKPAAKKAVAKKTAKKAAKRVAKKPAAKKTIKRTSTAVKTVKPRKKSTITSSFKKGEKKPFSFPQSVALSVVTMPTLPVDVDKMASALARYSGVTFVLLGAFFTMAHANLTGLVDIPLMANVTGSTSASFDEADTHHFDRHAKNEQETSFPSEPALPSVSFDIEQPEPLSGVVDVVVSVANVEAVKLYSFHRKTQEYIFIDEAIQSGNETWQIDWDTNQYEDGEYKLKAVVFGGFGSHDTTDDRYVVVQNELEEIVEEEVLAEEEDEPVIVFDEEVEDDLAFASSTVDASEQVVEIEVDRREDGALIKIFTEYEADRIEIKSADRQTGTLRVLGLADKIELNLWKYRWNTEVVEPSDYNLFAVAVTEEAETTSNKVIFSVRPPKILTEDLDSTANDPVSNEDNAEVNENQEVADSEDGLSLNNEIEYIQSEIIISFEEKLEESTGFLPLFIETTDAEFIEMYARGENDGRAKFIGLAQKISDIQWRFVWNTQNTPNGRYLVSARVKKHDGLQEGDAVSVRVFNETIVRSYEKDLIEKQREEIEETIQEVAVEREVMETDLSNNVVVGVSEELEVESLQNSLLLSYQDVPPPLSLTETVAPVVEREVAEVFVTYETEVNETLKVIASAVRSQDITAIELAKKRMEDLKADIRDEVFTDEDLESVADIIDNKVSRELAKKQIRVERSEQLIKERVSADIAKDSDKDGITDFDEVNLYGTDPLVADSDNDGFVDGVEILGGYNPNDASPEAVVAFESPKEAGVEREDLLVIESIAPVKPDSDDEQRDNNTLEAIISGKALPNSFVTLYVFSNPVVVTVKTDADGNWSYRFDKEIEDGTHEVYVGITDNAGRVVAKSKPIEFVKTAEAFTPVDAADEVPVVAQTKPESGMYTGGTMLLVGSISVVAIGLVLILLGLQLENRRRVPHMVAEGAA